MSSAPLPEGWKTVRLMIHGRVQGVSYRWWTVGEATKRGLDGWVRNRRDGSVEALVCGPVESVDAMIEACRQGPPAARVTDIEIAAVEGRAETGFQQHPTA